MNKVKSGKFPAIRKLVLAGLLFSLSACAASNPSTTYHDPNMDFALLRTVAIMPFQNFTGDKMAGERVRDTFYSSLLSTGAVYLIPPGEVARGISRAGITNPAEPSTAEIAKIAAIINADAFITGAVKEYGVVRSGSTSANVISLSVQMMEAQSKKVVWSASTSKGGISTWDRLLGGGGEPMNKVTKAAVDELIARLFR